MAGGAILIFYIFLYNITLFGLTNKQNFNFSDGNSIRWYAITPDGLKYFDKPGFDPIYRIKLKKVTSEKIEHLKSLEGGKPKQVNPENSTFFNSITGKPMIWYAKLKDGSYSFFDKPGFHPIIGIELKPVSRKIISEWKIYREQQKDTSTLTNDKINNDNNYNYTVDSSLNNLNNSKAIKYSIDGNWQGNLGDKELKLTIQKSINSNVVGYNIVNWNNSDWSDISKVFFKGRYNSITGEIVLNEQGSGLGVGKFKGHISDDGNRLSGTWVRLNMPGQQLIWSVRRN